MKTILEVITLSTQYLKDKGIERPRRQAEELVAHALGLKRIELYIQFDRPLVEKELTKCRSFLLRRGKKEPLQYIQGKVEFFEALITINSKVLIPRLETEILADRIGRYLEKIPLEGKVLWDICCGSGCLGIALKKRFPQLTVELSDLSDEALKIAEKNAKLNRVECQLHQGDLWQPFIGRKADFIVSNPPYIAEPEYTGLDEEVRLFEPKMALVSGPTGLEYYEIIAKDLKNYLTPQGKLWMEMGRLQGPQILEIFGSQHWKTSVEKDWAGHDRFFFLEREE